MAVHITAVPIAERGLIHLDISVSGASPASFQLLRRDVGSTETQAVPVPAAWMGSDGLLTPINWQAAFDDATAPLDVAVEYLVATVAGGTPTLASNQATLVSSGTWWLGDPLRPYLNLALSMSGTSAAPCSAGRGIFVLQLGDDRRDAQSVLLEQPGRADRLHVTYPTRLPSSKLELATRQLADRQAVEDLLAPGGALLLRVPGTLGYGIVNRFLSVTGSTESRLVRDSRKPWRHWTMDYEAVLQPPGGTFGTTGTTWDSLCGGAYATFADALAAGISWRSIADGIPGGVYPAAFRTWSEVSAAWATWGALTATGKTWLQVESGA